MSKKHKKNKRNLNVGTDAKMQEVLSDMLECGNCADAGTFSVPKKSGIEQIEHLCNVLPGIKYIEDLLVDYIFSNGLTTGNIEQDKVLNNFLYKNNRQGNTNLAVLRDVIGNASTIGETGIRWYDGDIYKVDPGTYGALTDRNDGIEYPVAYFCSADGRFVSDKDISIVNNGNIETVEDYYRWFEEQKLILLDTSDFVNVRNTTKTLHGESPLLSDQLRVSLLEAVYSRLNYDIKYDGPGRIILRPKDGYVSGDVNEIDTAEIVNQSMVAAGHRLDKAKEEVKRIGNEIKYSTSDDVILLSNAFSPDITHLERVTKATQFFDWLDNEGAIIAQAIGLPPSLLEMGKVSGNVSMQRILDNAMENAIVPLREKFAIQISPLLSEKLGVDKVYFDKYQLASAPDRETMRTKVVEMMTMLNSIETPETKQLVKDFASMLSYDIHNSDGSLVELGVGQLPDDELYKLGSKESKSHE